MSLAHLPKPGGKRGDDLALISCVIPDAHFSGSDGNEIVGRGLTIVAAQYIANDERGRRMGHLWSPMRWLGIFSSKHTFIGRKGSNRIGCCLFKEIEISPLPQVIWLIEGPF